MIFCVKSLANLVGDGPLKITRFPSVRRFDMNDQVTMSGVEIRFSDPKFQIVQALYGIRYASLGGGNVGSLNSQGETRSSAKEAQRPAKRRFMHSVAAFIYETPQGHLKKTSLPPVCPQTIPDPDVKFSNPRLRDRLRKIIPFLSDQSEDCLTLNIYAPNTGNLAALSLPCIRWKFDPGLNNLLKIAISTSKGICLFF